MATVRHQTQYYDLGVGGLGPGRSYWMSWGPDDRFKDSTVIIKANPTTAVAGQTFLRRNVLSVGPVFVTTDPAGDINFPQTEAHVGVNITNAGQYTIRYFSLSLTIISA